MKIANVYFVCVDGELEGSLRALPIKVVAEIGQADIVFVGSDFVGDLLDEMMVGVVPVVPEKYGFIDYDPVREVGDAFNYDPENSVLAIYALSRAIENHKFVYDWKSIQSNFNTRLKLSKKMLI